MDVLKWGWGSVSGGIKGYLMRVLTQRICSKSEHDESMHQGTVELHSWCLQLIGRYRINNINWRGPAASCNSCARADSTRQARACRSMEEQQNHYP